MLRCVTKLYKVDVSHEEIESLYLTLMKNNNISFFLSWGWIDTWLKLLPYKCEVYFITLFQRELPVCCFFVGRKAIIRGKIFRINQITLNTSGNSEYDNIWIEYNSIICLPGFNLDLKAVLNEISVHWDEVYLPGLDLTAFPANSLSSLSPPFKYIEDNSAVSPYVDLEKVRQAGGDYLSLLSSNTRGQIRRSLKILEEIGPVALEVPNSLERAFEIYHEMIDLHQTTWQIRGEDGAFSSPLFCRFHERLITNRFAKGEIQLLRIHVGGSTIGCLYSFVWQSHIYFYQCGFNYSFGKRVKPGLVSHYLAVQYNADQGHDVYDFLAGDARYKKSLATDYNKMSWGRIQKRSWKFFLEEKLRGLYESFRGDKIG